LIISKFLASEIRFSWSEKPKNRMGRDMDYMADVLLIHFYQPEHKIQFLGFSNHEKGSSEARNFEVINGLQYVFEKWVERCKNCIACQRRYFEKETLTAPPLSSVSE
jgi:hypothetical protein